MLEVLYGSSLDQREVVGLGGNSTVLHSGGVLLLSILDVRYDDRRSTLLERRYTHLRIVFSGSFFDGLVIIDSACRIATTHSGNGRVASCVLRSR